MSSVEELDFGTVKTSSPFETHSSSASPSGSVEGSGSDQAGEKRVSSPPTLALTSASLLLNARSIGKVSSMDHNDEVRQRFMSEASVMTFDTLNDFESPHMGSSSEFDSVEDLSESDADDEAADILGTTPSSHRKSSKSRRLRTSAFTSPTVSVAAGSDSAAGGASSDKSTDSVAVDMLRCPADELRNYTPQELQTIYSEAHVKFNVRPSQARDYLVTKKAVQGLPSEFAQFIFEHNQHLSKRRIGEYIGRGDLYNQQVCDSLMHKFDFSNLSLDGAIRDLMKRFRLPGESQQIDRILEKFAKSYFTQNPSVLCSQDLVHILSFSIMMLNTDLHNQSIAPQKKMTLEEFIRNNRGINRGQDLPREMLEAIYNRVKENEIRMNENDQYESDNVTFMNPVKSGWVQKKSDILIPQWKRRWFVLSGGCLYYFSAPVINEEGGPRGIIPLDNTKIGRGDYKNEFVITSANGDIVKSSKVVGKGNMQRGLREKYVLRVRDEEERDLWVKSLQEESSKFLPLHDFFKKLRNPKEAGAAQDTLNLPKPLIEGWMRKRSSNLVTWNKRYFVLFPDFDGCGITLFYYMSEQLAQRMIDFGLQTQQGFLRFRKITKVTLATDGTTPSLEMFSGFKSWRFSPEPPSMLDAWLRELSKACEMYAEARRLQEVAELEEMQTGNSMNPPTVPTQMEEDSAAAALSFDLSSINEPTVMSDDSLLLVASDSKNLNEISRIEETTTLG